MNEINIFYVCLGGNDAFDFDEFKICIEKQKASLIDDLIGADEVVNRVWKGDPSCQNVERRLPARDKSNLDQERRIDSLVRELEALIEETKGRQRHS